MAQILYSESTKQHFLKDGDVTEPVVIMGSPSTGQKFIQREDGSLIEWNGSGEVDVKSEGGFLGGVRAAASGALLNAGPQAAGLARAAQFGVQSLFDPNVPMDRVPDMMRTGYELERDRSKQLEEEYARRHPKTDMGLRAAGAISTAGVGTAGLYGKMALAPLAIKTGGGAALGATEAATAGYFGSKDGQQMQGGVIGGAIGTLIGGGIPVIGAVLGPIAARGFSEISKRYGSTSKEAYAFLGRAMSASKMSADDVVNKMKSMGPESAPVDTSRQLRGLGEAGAQRPGMAQETAEAFAMDRRSGQMDRVQGIFAKYTGTGNSVMIPAESGAFAKTLTESVPITQTLKRVFARPSMRDAWNKATFLANEAERPGMMSYDDFMADVTAGKITGVKTELLHWIKKGLDDVIEPKRDAQTGQLFTEFGKNELVAREGTRKLFRGELKSLNSKYGAELDRLSGEFRVDDAYQLGLDALKPSHNVDDVLKRFKTDREINAYKAGVSEAAMSKVSNVVEKGNDAGNILLNNSSKFKKIFGEDIVNDIKNQRDMFRTESAILRGSQTSERESIKELMDQGVSPGEVTSTFGSVVDAGKSAVNYIAGNPTSRALDELGTQFLYKNNPEMAKAYVKMAEEAWQKKLMSQQGAGGILGLLSSQASAPILP